MNREYTQSEADQHNALAERGWAILNDHILLKDRDHARIGFFARRRLRNAIACFQDALTIAPDKYSTKWALGKTYQALGDHRTSLKWFREALELEQSNADVFREASLAAMDCNDFSLALNYSDGAIRLRPDDAGLHCNRSLVLMFLGRDDDAIQALATSLQLSANDRITLAVRDIVHSVADGNRLRPKSMKEI